MRSGIHESRFFLSNFHASRSSFSPYHASRINPLPPSVKYFRCTCFSPRLAPSGCSCLGVIIRDGVIKEGNGNEFKASLENQHLRNGDASAIIASSLHHLLLTEHAENGLLEA